MRKEIIHEEESAPKDMMNSSVLLERYEPSLHCMKPNEDRYRELWYDFPLKVKYKKCT
jgi:hypothetical protein